MQSCVGVARIVGEPLGRDIRFIPAGVEVSRYRNDFEAGFAKGSRRSEHVHRRGHQQDSPDALGGEYFVTADGVLVGVDGGA